MPERLFSKEFDRLPVEVYADNNSLGQAAAAWAAEILLAALAGEEMVNLIVATGNSQLSFYTHLAQIAGIPWKRVRIFHMDEYVGMLPDHPASFRRYLLEKLVYKVHPAAFYGVNGDAPDSALECLRYAALLEQFPAALCCLGIGENGHLAFNDPPFADFNDPLLVKVVTLDERSRKQQVGEGHFSSLAKVPTQAITLTIPALLRARQVLAIVPEKRKAEAVRAALTGPLTTACPASILRTVPNCRLFLDQESGGLIL
jgi:glucosamine-6-phosphate deaminase